MTDKQKTAIKVLIGSILSAILAFVSAYFLESCASVSASVEKATLDVQPIQKSSSEYSEQVYEDSLLELDSIN